MVWDVAEDQSCLTPGGSVGPTRSDRMMRVLEKVGLTNTIIWEDVVAFPMSGRTVIISFPKSQGYTLDFQAQQKKYTQTQRQNWVAEFLRKPQDEMCAHHLLR